MFRTPVKRNRWRLNEAELTDSPEVSPKYKTPPDVLIVSNSLILFKTRSPSPVKKTQEIDTKEIILRAELEVVKNELEKEKKINDSQKREIEELQLNAEKLQKNWKEEKSENFELKKCLKEIQTIKEIEEAKYQAQIQVLQEENLKLLKNISDYKFVETQVSLIQEELEQKYKARYLKLKEKFRKQAEKVKKKENELKSDKKNISSMINILIQKVEQSKPLRLSNK